MAEHRVRNASILGAVGVGVFVYTVWTDARAQWKNHKPLEIPKWMSSPKFVPTVITPRQFNPSAWGPTYDYDRFEMELGR